MNDTRVNVGGGRLHARPHDEAREVDDHGIVRVEARVRRDLVGLSEAGVDRHREVLDLRGGEARAEGARAVLRHAVLAAGGVRDHEDGDLEVSGRDRLSR
jgi:hypothetical protein